MSHLVEQDIFKFFFLIGNIFYDKVKNQLKFKCCPQIFCKPNYIEKNVSVT